VITVLPGGGRGRPSVCTSFRDLDFQRTCARICRRGSLARLIVSPFSRQTFAHQRLLPSHPRLSSRPPRFRISDTRAFRDKDVQVPSGPKRFPLSLSLSLSLSPSRDRHSSQPRIASPMEVTMYRSLGDKARARKNASVRHLDSIGVAGGAVNRHRGPAGRSLSPLSVITADAGISISSAASIAARTSVSTLRHV